MRIRQLVCFFLFLTAWTCPQHKLSDGNYTLTPTDTTLDDCQFWSGTISMDANLEIAGDTLRLDLVLPNGSFRLVGAFEETSERFYADSSGANFVANVRSHACSAESVSLHLTGITDSSQSFHGTLRTVLRSQADPSCNCDLLLSYRADRP